MIIFLEGPLLVAVFLSLVESLWYEIFGGVSTLKNCGGYKKWGWKLIKKGEGWKEELRNYRHISLPSIS